MKKIYRAILCWSEIQCKYSWCSHTSVVEFFKYFKPHAMRKWSVLILSVKLAQFSFCIMNSKVFDASLKEFYCSTKLSLWIFLSWSNKLVTHYSFCNLDHSLPILYLIPHYHKRSRRWNHQYLKADTPIIFILISPTPKAINTYWSLASFYPIVVF